MCRHVCLAIDLDDLEIICKLHNASCFPLEINKRGPVKKIICKKGDHKRAIRFYNNGFIETDTDIEPSKACTNLRFLNSRAWPNKIPGRKDDLTGVIPGNNTHPWLFCLSCMASHFVFCTSASFRRNQTKHAWMSESHQTKKKQSNLMISLGPSSHAWLACKERKIRVLARQKLPPAVSASHLASVVIFIHCNLRL